MSYTSEQVKSAYRRLPQSAQEIFAAIETEEEVLETGRKHGLHIDQWGKLNNEVTGIILGLEPASAFPERLIKELGIDQATANAIAAELNEGVFLKIREAMKQVSKPDLRELPGSPTTAAPTYPSANQVLSEIENPPPAWGSPSETETKPVESSRPTPIPTPAPNILEQKLGGTFQLPRVETATKEEVEEMGGGTPAVDPYREIPQ